MDLQEQILQALQQAPLSADELYRKVDPETSVQAFQEALYQLREQRMWVEKHPVIDGGCKACGCSIHYMWRLTIGGRQHLKEKQEST